MTTALEARDRAPDQLLPAALAAYLQAAVGGGVYDQPEAFERFIDGGGNARLYAATIEAIADIHRIHRPDRVLDVGCGDGRVTAGVLSSGTSHVDLLEPSAELLARATSRLSRARPHNQTLAAFLGDAEPQRRWNLVQSTFALHAIEPAERHGLLADLARHTPRLLVAEFDVPQLAPRSGDHIEYLADRYERGLAEYSGDPLVAQGFLLPVLVGQLDPATPRVTWEQPIERWAADLEVAGFADVTASPLDDYWWAPAHLIEACG